MMLQGPDARVITLTAPNEFPLRPRPSSGDSGDAKKESARMCSVM
jgi:hypothetical protein